MAVVVGPARADAMRGWTPGSSGTSTVSGDSDVQQTEQPAEPPRGLVEQREAGCVTEREAEADRQVDEEPGDPGPVGIGSDDGAEQQRQVQAGESRQLRADHHDGERGGRNEPEQCPAGPVHLSGQPARAQSRSGTTSR